MKLGSTGMSTSHWCAIVALWFAPGTKEGHSKVMGQHRVHVHTRFKVGFYPRDTWVTSTKLYVQL